MKTDGVIIESLLGQANALDDYAVKSRTEEVRKKRYANEKIKLGVKIIKSLIIEKKLD